MSSPAVEQAPASHDSRGLSEQTIIVADQESGKKNDTKQVAPYALGAGPAPDGGVRAWLMAAGAASVFLCTLGLASSFGTFEAYYFTHQLKGISASPISWIGSLQSFLQFFSGILAGPLFDRLGVKIFWPSAVVYLFALMMLSLCKTYWEIMLVQGVLMGLVMGFLQIPTCAAVSQYFDKNRAAARGLAVPGVPVDKYGRLNTFAIGGAATGILVSWMTSATSNAGLIVNALFFGFFSGTVVSGASATFATCPSNPQQIGTYMGMGMAVLGVGVLIGPPFKVPFSRGMGVILNAACFVV